MNTSISKSGPIPTRFTIEIGKLDLQGRFLPVELLSGLTMAADGHPLCGAAPEESEEHFANRFHRYLLITVKCWGLRWLVHFQDLHGSMLQYYRLFCLFFCFYVLFQFSLSPPLLWLHSHLHIFTGLFPPDFSLSQLRSSVFWFLLFPYQHIQNYKLLTEFSHLTATQADPLSLPMLLFCT